jgi:hypothetical protein
LKERKKTQLLKKITKDVVEKIKFKELTRQQKENLEAVCK